MNAVAQVIQFPAADVDQLGELLAQIADLEAKAEQIKQSLRERGPGCYEGALFAAVVSEEKISESLNSKAAKAKLLELNVDPKWIAANSRITISKGAVRVGAR